MLLYHGQPLTRELQLDKLASVQIHKRITTVIIVIR